MSTDEPEPSADKPESEASKPHLLPHAVGPLVTGSFLVLTTLITIFLTPIGSKLWEIGTGQKPEPSHIEEYLNEIQAESVKLRNDYINLGPNPKPRDDEVIGIRKRAKTAATQLTILDDSRLQDSDKLIKYCFSGMLYMIMASLESTPKSAAENAEKAKDTLDICLIRIESASKAAARGDKHDLALNTWIAKSQVDEWARYNRAVVAAILAQNQDDKASASWPDVGGHLEELSQTFLDDFPIHENPQLTWACSNLPGASKDHCYGVIGQNE